MTPTQTFISTLSQTPNLASALKANLQRLKDNLQQIITVLTYSKTVADDLTKLSNVLNVTIDALTVVSVVPEVGQAASAIKAVLQTLKPEVTTAKNAAVTLENRVKPVREALQKLPPLLDKAIAVADGIATNSSSFLSKFNTVFACVEGLPAGAARDQSEQYLNQFSTRFQPAVAALNTALNAANTAIGGFYSALQQVVSAFSFLQGVASAIGQFMSALQPVTDLLDELEKALRDIKITIPIPFYPVTVSLYDVFENFSAFIDLAMAPIQDLVNQIISALHIPLPQIPGLQDIINLLNINLPSIPDFTGLTQAVSDAIAQLQTGFNLFHLDCPPKT